MDRFQGLCLSVVLAMAACSWQANAVAMVMGNVFCDQCFDGHQTLYSFPLYGATVRVDCKDDDGEITFSKEGSTDLIGSFVMKFDGVPDMSGCAAQLIGSPQGSGCNIVGSPARPLDLTFSLFAMEIYSVDPLFFHPERPMSFCPSRSHPIVKPLPPLPFIKPSPPSPLIKPLPPPTPLPFIKPLPPLPPLPFLKPWPPLPPFPFIKPWLPPLPFTKPSACPHYYWLRPQYRCYWKLVSPNTTVVAAFGEAAGRKYGKNVSLWHGLFGRGDVYSTLLREATASLLNSYSSLLFQYNTLTVVDRLNSALQGSTQDALIQALKFKRANYGGGKTECLLVPCK